MALTMIFFSAGVSSRCPTLLSGGGASVPDDCAEDDGASGVADGGADARRRAVGIVVLAVGNGEVGRGGFPWERDGAVVVAGHQHDLEQLVAGRSD